VQVHKSAESMKITAQTNGSSPTKLRKYRRWMTTLELDLKDGVKFRGIAMKYQIPHKHLPPCIFINFINAKASYNHPPCHTQHRLAGNHELLLAAIFFS